MLYATPAMWIMEIADLPDLPRYCSYYNMVSRSDIAEKINNPHTALPTRYIPHPPIVFSFELVVRFPEIAHQASSSLLLVLVLVLYCSDYGTVGCYPDVTLMLPGYNNHHHHLLQ